MRKLIIQYSNVCVSAREVIIMRILRGKGIFSREIRTLCFAIAQQI